jgi:hypothetical protein
MSYWGYTLLAVWLILTGLITLFRINLHGIAVIFPLLSFIAGLLIFISGLKSKFVNNMGGLFLSIWIIAQGLQSYIHFPNSGTVLAILAVVAGVMIIIRK